MKSLLYIAGFGLVGKAFVEKYLKESLKEFWLNSFKGDINQYSDMLFNLLVTCFIGVLSLSVYILTKKEEEVAVAVAPATSAVPAVNESELLAAIQKKRRSIFPKDYTEELIDDKQIEHILECANTAPTHGKNEPWRFVVYRRENFGKFIEVVEAYYAENKSKLYKSTEEAEKAAASRQEKFSGLRKASHIILISMKRYGEKNTFPEWEEIAATAAAVQNIYLQTAAKGLAGFWSSMTFAKEARDSQSMRDLLKLSHVEDRFFGGFAIAKTTDLSRFTRIPGNIKDKVQFI